MAAAHLHKRDVVKVAQLCTRATLFVVATIVLGEGQMLSRQQFRSCFESMMHNWERLAQSALNADKISMHC